MLRFVAKTVFLMLATVCAVIPGASAVVQTSSGLEGQALIGPTCPVARPSDQQCADKPYRTTVIIKTLDGKEIKRVTTDAQGKFRIALEPEFYTIFANPGKGMQVLPVKDAPVTLRLPDHQVQVVAGRFTAVKLIFDSGIR